MPYREWATHTKISYVLGVTIELIIILWNKLCYLGRDLCSLSTPSCYFFFPSRSCPCYCSFLFFGSGKSIGMRRVFHSPSLYKYPPERWIGKIILIYVRPKPLLHPSVCIPHIRPFSSPSIFPLSIFLRYPFIPFLLQSPFPLALFYLYVSPSLSLKLIENNDCK